ncbi:hypothetical protein [Granulicella cerasi]|nr:hypothetical protein [Granulicella cerasi]
MPTVHMTTGTSAIEDRLRGLLVEVIGLGSSAVGRKAAGNKQ